MSMQFGCIARHLGHSWSKEIHALLGSYDYTLRELSPEEVGPFLRARDFDGVNVTIPYKQTVMPYLDVTDSAAAVAGSVNTVVNRGGRLYGYNTDIAGMKYLLSRYHIDLEGKYVAVLGTGGTSLTARAVAVNAGAAHTVRVSRNPTEADCISYADLSAFRDRVEIIINTTPVGMFPNADGMPVNPADFPNLTGVADAVYNPTRTNLVLAARSCGIPAAGGLYMLVSQAAEAAALFLDDPSLSNGEVREAVYRRLMLDKCSPVLIGMPGAGKTTIGRIVAAKLKRPFFDTDTCLEEQFGMPVGDYIDRYGIETFRMAESALIHRLARNDGAVIATGGGAVLDRNNVRSLSHGGMLIFADRPLSDITPTPNRPLSRTADALAELYRARLPVLRAAADAILPVNGTPETCADVLIRLWEEGCRDWL